ncbi:MAG: FtsX-like permease family protein [Sarcina sp.]
MNFFSVFKKQLKSNPVTISIFIIIFLISSLGLSLLVSVISNFSNRVVDYNQSFEEYTLEAKLAYNDEGYNHEKMIDSLELVNGDFRIRSSFEYFEIEGIKNREVNIAEYFTGNWENTYPMIAGEFYTKEQIKNKEKVVLLGKNIANKYSKKINDSINIDKENYKIIGIVGYQNKKSVFDDSIFTPITAISEMEKNVFGSIPYKNFYISGKEKYQTIELNDLINILKEKDEKVDLLIAKELDKTENGVSDSIYMNLGMVLIVIAITVFAILNIILINYFWIKDRRFEIGIRKAFGIKNKYIILLLLSEILSIMIVSSLLTIIINLLISIIVNKWYEYNLYFNIYNILAIIIFNILISIVISIVPIIKAIKIEPIEIVKGE